MRESVASKYPPSLSGEYLTISGRANLDHLRYEMLQQVLMPCLSVAVEDGQPEHEPFIQINDTVLEAAGR